MTNETPMKIRNSYSVPSRSHCNYGVYCFHLLDPLTPMLALLFIQGSYSIY